MTMRLAALALSLGGLLLVAACWLQPPGWVAVRAVEVLGGDAAAHWAQQGRPVLLLHLLAREIVLALPWLAAGMALALSLRALLARWQAGASFDAAQRVIDAAGVEFTMAGCGFSHAPNYGRLPLAPMPASQLPPGAGEFERQAFAALAAVPEVARAAETARAEYAAAVADAGPAALPTIVAVARHLGDAARSADVAHAGVSAAIAATRLPAFWRLPAAGRDRLITALALRGGAQRPVDLDSELARIAARFESAERCGPSSSSSPGCAATGREAVNAALVAALSGLSGDLPSWNVNGNRQRHAPVEAWWLTREAALVVPAARLRRWLSQRMTAQELAELRLDMPSTGAHPSDAAIEAALRAARLAGGAPVWRLLRIDSMPRGRVVVLTASSAWSAAVTARWGEPPRTLNLEAP
jgi:hypothetical protein